MPTRFYTATMYRSGARMGDIPVISTNGSISTNDIGYCSIVTPRYHPFDPGRTIHFEDFFIDNDVWLWKHENENLPEYYPGYRMFAGKILDRDEFEDSSGEYIRLGIYGLNELLRRRDVDYQATAQESTGYTIMTDYADDMMKEIVQDNMGSDAITARQFSSNFSIETQRGAGPSITYEFPHQNVLDVLQHIAEISAGEGTDLFFDVVMEGFSQYEFRTYTGQLGSDISDKSYFSDTFGTISNAVRSESYSEEYNVVNAWGKGDPGNQEKSQQEDTTRSSRIPFGRKEFSINAGNMDATALESYAKMLLRDGRPRVTFSCNILSNPLKRVVYGTHWKFGDKAKVTFNGRVYTGVIRNVTWSYKLKNLTDVTQDSLYGRFVYAGVT